jgi:hypothetical protein
MFREHYGCATSLLFDPSRHSLARRRLAGAVPLPQHESRIMHSTLLTPLSPTLTKAIIYLANQVRGDNLWEP